MSHRPARKLAVILAADPAALGLTTGTASAERTRTLGRLAREHGKDFGPATDKNHIITEVKHYRGKIYSCDVVNDYNIEAIGPKSDAYYALIRSLKAQRVGAALPYDENLLPQPAYYAIRDALSS
jgi:GH35 family endo-1,4-beta-xylanase